MSERRIWIIFGFALAAVYCPAIVGGTAVPRWLLLAAVVPVVLICASFAGRVIEVTWAHVLGAMLLGWAALTMLWSANHYDSVDALWKLALLGGCFALGSMTDDARPLFIGLGLGVAVSSVFVLVEFATGWALPAVIGPTGLYAGLFGNRNYLGEAAVLVLIGLAVCEGPPNLLGGALWRWVALLAGLLPALVLPAARGAWAGLVVAVCAGVWSIHPRVAAAFAVVAGTLIGVAVWWSPGSIIDRLNIWNDAVYGLSLLGTGIGTFGATIAQHAHLTDPLSLRNTHAHNEPLQIAYELGLPGLLLACAFVLSVLRSGRPERFVFIAFLVEGLFAFPASLPVTGAVGALCAGGAARGLPRVRLETLLGRGSLRARSID